MDIIERINEERFVESLICLWIQPDAPEWIIDYVRTELRKQRGLLEEKDLKAMEKVNGRYSEDIMNSLVNLMTVFLKDHEIYMLMELVASAVATKAIDRMTVEQRFDETYGVYGGTCPTCGNWIQNAHSFCGFCGQPIAWEKKENKRIPHSHGSNTQWT